MMYVTLYTYLPEISPTFFSGVFIEFTYLTFKLLCHHITLGVIYGDIAMVLTFRFLVLVFFSTLMCSSALTEETKLEIKLDFGTYVDAGAVSFLIQPGSEAVRVTVPGTISRSTRTTTIERNIVRPEKDDYVFMFGKLLDANQQIQLYFPVSVIDPYAFPRHDFIQITRTSVASRKEAFFQSFPISIGVSRAIDQYGLVKVLSGIKIVLDEKLAETSNQWGIITSDFLKNVPAQLLRDSSKIRTALEYLSDYIGIAESREYDRFYVELLLKLKRLNIGGTLVDNDTTLDSFISSELHRLYLERVVHIYDLSANVIESFTESNSPSDVEECISLGDTLMNALQGVMAGADPLIDIKDDPASQADIISLMQKLSLCAQLYYLHYGGEKANRVDVKGAADFLVSSEDGRDFLERYLQVYRLLDQIDVVQRFPPGTNKSRIQEINKYADQFDLAVNADAPI